MYNQSYEDYMQSVLGYSIGPEIYHTYDNYEGYTNVANRSLVSEEYFPDIYKKINPIICEECNKNTRPFSRELAEEITEQIYQRIQNEKVIALEEHTIGETRNNTKDTGNIENRQGKNRNLLKDLILILTLQQLSGRTDRPPRPPYPGPGMPPPRPPFPGGPRPPQHRGYNSYLQF